MEETFDITIVTTETFTQNKFFKRVVRENNFEKIKYNIVKPTTRIDKLENFKSKLYILMGEESLKCFNLNNKDINEIAGKFIVNKEKGYSIFVTYSLIDLVSDMDPMFLFVEDHFKKISELYFKTNSNNTKIVLNKDRCLDTCYSYKLPDWCYSEDYILIDIQNNKYENKIVFRFRDKEGKNRFHFENSKKRYFYVNPIEIRNSDIIKNINEVEIHFKQQGLLDNVAIYEGDLAQELKHSIDYYYNRKTTELKYSLKKLFWDIEVYTGDHQGFPWPLEAKFPINSISFTLDYTNDIYVYLLNMKGIDLKSYSDGEELFSSNDIESYIENNYKNIFEENRIKLKVFDTEKELIQEFIKKIKELDPDLLCGWNTDGFDVPYLINRMFKLNISLDSLSPIDETDINTNELYEAYVYGLHFIDQLVLYKKLTQNVEESYKLSSISQKILGSDKVAYEGTINDMYEGDLIKFILYSGIDTKLLAELDDTLKHIDLNFDLIKTCCSTWERSKTTMGLVDPLLIKFAKDRNKVCRNKIYNTKVPFDGAYVLEPKVGIHKWLIDLDFKSLYPSIILTLNLGPNTFKAKIDEKIAQLYLFNFDKLPKEISIIENPILKNSNIIKVDPNGLKEYIEKNNCILSINGCMLKQHEEELSFFYEVLKYLGDMRDSYKKELGDIRLILHEDKTLTDEKRNELTTLLNQYNNKQMVVKVISNSIYGVISTPHFRMFNIDIAKAITSTGQEVLKYSIIHTSNFMKNDDTDININFLRDFESSDLGYIQYGDSVGKDSIIILEKCNKTIEELWNECDSETIYTEDGKERKKIDIKVLSSTNDKMSKFLDCTYIIRHKVSKKMYRIEISKDNYLDVTEDHSLIQLDENLNYMESKPLYSKYLLLNKFIPRNNIISKNFSKEVYEFFGYWIGDGSYNRLNCNNFTCISSGIDTEEFIEKILEPLKLQKIISNYYKSKNNYDLKILSKTFTTLMRNLDFKGISSTKRVPEWLFLETEENICSFLRGYFSADGSVVQNTINLTSINKDLLKDVKLLLNYCNISSRIIKDRSGNNYKSEKITSYSYQLRIYSIKEFTEKIGFIFNRKNSNIKNSLRIIVNKTLRDIYRTKNKIKYNSDFVILSSIEKSLPEYNIEKNSTLKFQVHPKKINKIYEIEYDDYVYDLTIPETQKFFANDILVHNTDSIFIQMGDYMVDKGII